MGSRGKSSKISIIYTFFIITGLVCIAGFIGLNISFYNTKVEEQHLTEQEFQSFIETFNKYYETNDEYQRRLQIFTENLSIIRFHNSQNYNWALGVNQFADLTSEEFSTLLNTHIGISAKKYIEININESIPPQVDWRTKGAITPVRNQWLCGSCWAFAAAGTVESAWFLAGHDLVPLSEQELVDCSWSYGNTGCGGGESDFGFQFVVDNGLTTEKSYPYVPKDGECNWEKASNVAATISSYADVIPNNSTALLNAISKQPVAVAVQGNQDAFKFYMGGVIDRDCGTNLTHAVIAVGYDILAPIPYYIIKNTFSTLWGEKGYARIAIQEGEGVCGIQKVPSYPII